METYLIAAMALVLLLLTRLLQVGGRAIRGGNAKDQGDLPSRWPAVALIVPVSGADPGLTDRLGTLLNQDYPDYQTLFVTRDAADPAFVAIRAAISGHPRARQVISGTARTCGQKNHNLLAGVRLAGSAPEILAFCDSNQSAPATFLRELVKPIALGRAEVVSGYHQVIPQGKIAGWGRAVTVLALYLTKGFRRLNQPWGGATAINRRLFEDLGIDRVWAENVVDDVSLAAKLIQVGIPVGLAPGACLATTPADESVTEWSHWLFRQWIYLKFCLPASWLAAGLLQHLLLALVVLSGVGCLTALANWRATTVELAGALFLVALTALGINMRKLHPRPAPLRLWLAAFYAALAMGSWCHLKTCFTKEIHWRGITYRVARRGRVREIREG